MRTLRARLALSVDGVYEVKQLRLSQDGQRLVAVIPDQLPLRAAARAIRGGRFEGRDAGFAVFSYPIAAEVCTAILGAFALTVAPNAIELVGELVAQESALDEALEAKFSATMPAEARAAIRTEPMRHQCGAAAFALACFAVGARGRALFMEQGTGKSLVAIALAGALAAAGHIRWALIVCPNSLKGTWADPELGQIAEHSNFDAGVTVLKGPRAKRQRALDEALSRTGRFQWVVTNVEQFQVDYRTHEGFEDFCDAVRIAPPGLLVVDESSTCKNMRAQRTKALLALSRLFSYRLPLSGTPVTKAPLDVYPQCEIMEDACLGFATPLAFERAYAIFVRRRVFDGKRKRTIREVSEYRDLDDLERRLARVSFRARAEDCLDLPEVVTRTLPVELTKEQSSALRQLKGDMMAELEGGLVDGRNILSRYLRMAQITGGFVPVIEADGRPREAPIAFAPNPKLLALEGYLETIFDADPDRKAVVFSRFLPEIRAILDVCTRHGWEPVPFFGDVSPDDRESGLRRFRTSKLSRVFVAQYQTGSKGLNLVEASAILFFGLSFSLEDMLQSRKRVHRKGQTRKVEEVYLVGRTDKGGRTIDHVALEALRTKKNLADIVTGDSARQMLEGL